MAQIQTACHVVELKKINATYLRLVLEAPALAAAARPGQFIHIRVSDGNEPFFRRPFSIYRAQAGKVEILFEPVGRGSKLLASRKRGDVLDVLGPLGHGFTPPGKDVKQVVFIAGGIGVAPFMIFSDAIKEHKAEKILLYGARSKAQTFATGGLKKNGVKVFVATDDGSVGTSGRVSELFDRVKASPDTMIYTCGPRPMMAAVQAFARTHGLKGEVSCEEVMACGLGACLGCSIPTVNGYRTVCHDGPVFDLQAPVFG